ncbi:hypothetical protein PVAG01_02328 [Phlyctema vagabunda]|uniref:Uncharacterized protein n=1 Tax=Phlyctema vagabunda TaxID=108571 RepID=A0ABR4PQB6_9HELO
MTILTIWDVPEAAKWYAFNTYYALIGMNGVVYNFANESLRHNDAERGVVIVFMNLAAQATKAWSGNLLFQTVEAPQFRKGYASCAVFAAVMIAWTWVVKFFAARQEHQRAVRKANTSDTVLEFDQSTEGNAKETREKVVVRSTDSV